MTTRTASKAYGEHFEALLALVQDMPGQCGNLASDARTVNWGHVGDMSRLADLARQLAAEIESVTAAHHPRMAA